MSKSIKFKNNAFLDSKGIVHNKELLNDILDSHFYKYEDTVANDIKELLRKKIEYADNLCIKDYENLMFPGGWYGTNYGFSIYSKNTTTKHLIWISTFGIYLCRLTNGSYEYKEILWTSI